MLNFNRITYFDVKRYQNLINNNIYLSFYNPNYLFLWKDLYKTEIVFKDNIPYFKIFMDDEFFYFIPFSDNLEDSIKYLKNDAKDNVIDFNIVGINEMDLNKYKNIHLNPINNKLYDSYIYSSYSFIELKKKYLKYIKFLNKSYKLEVSLLDRSDINDVIVFASTNSDTSSPSYFPSLNMLKNLNEYQHELKIDVIALKEENDFKAVIVASFLRNTLFIHKVYYKSFEFFIYLINSYTKLYGNLVKYINIEEDGINLILKNDGLIKLAFIEKCYALYNK